MEKMTKITFLEAKEYVAENNEKLQAMYNNAPEINGDEPGKFIGRGFAMIKDHINKNGRPRVDDPKKVVSIRLPMSAIKFLRSTGRGWQTRVSEYINNGIRHGIFQKAQSP